MFDVTNEGPSPAMGKVYGWFIDQLKILHPDSTTYLKSDAIDVANKGPSISSTAMGKVYGWFIDQLKILNPDSTTMELVSKYPHPVMCVIGCESTGKSATIESICKVPIFPSDTGICTRCPIKVVLIPTEPETPILYELSLQGKKFIYKENELANLKRAIAKCFVNLVKDSNNCHGYSDEVITVVVHHPDVIRMDFVDLPGIVSYPPEAKAFTLSLSQKYIVDPACFILCVAPATTPRLTSYEPIAHIIAAKACERSIIVLPMADKLASRDFDTHLLNRVTMASDELQGHPFTACCAVVNRSNESDCSLTQQARHEQEWFLSNILQPMQQSINHCKTTNTKEARTQCAAMQLTMNWASVRVGINMLLQVTNEKYEEHIKARWMPRTLDEISKDITRLTTERDLLGVLPSAENLQQFRNYYSENVHRVIWNYIMKKLCVLLEVTTEAELLQMSNSTAFWKTIEKEFKLITIKVLNKLGKPGTITPSRNDLPIRWMRFERSCIPCIFNAMSDFLAQLQPHFHVLYPFIHREHIMKQSPDTFHHLLTVAFAESA